MKYQWKDSNYKASADMVGRRVAQLEKQHGVCHPKLLVDDARPLTSPLHDLFEWDDQAAAESYRIDQARGVLQAIRVVFQEGDEPVMAFVHVRLEGAPGYVSIIRAMSDGEMREQVLGDALAALEALKRRYDGLRELQPVWQATRKVKESRKAKVTAS